MEEKSKDSRLLYLIIGFLLAVVIFLAGGKLREWSVFGAKFEFPTETPSATAPIPSIMPSTLPSQPTIIPVQPTVSLNLPTVSQCSHIQAGSTAIVIPAEMWVVTRICSPARSACFYTLEQSTGGEYSSYEHSGTDDRRWVNAFCTEGEAKAFANTDAKAMLSWWPTTDPNPFP